MKRRKLTVMTLILMLLLIQSVILTGCKSGKNNENQTKIGENVDQSKDPEYFKQHLYEKYKMVIPIEFSFKHTSKIRGTEGVSLGGRIEKGRLKVGNKIDIIGQDPDSGEEVTYFKDIEVLELYGIKDGKEELFDELKEEDNLGVYIEGIDHKKVECGMYAIIR